MAVYKKPCIHCGTLIDGDARYCSKCASASPFGYSCPTCLKDISKDERICSACGRLLYVTCPSCKEETFVAHNCDRCKASLMVRCNNQRCGELQFFENTKCTSCGKKIS